MIDSAVRLITRYSQINWALADQALVSGVNFLTGLLLARYLGLEEFGRFTLAWIAVEFMNSLQHSMITAPMMSIGPKQPEQENSAYLGAVIVQQVCFALLTFLLLFFGASMMSVDLPEWHLEGLALPLACAALATQLQVFLRRYFFTRTRGIMSFVNDLIRYLGQLAVLVWLFQVADMDTAKVLWVIATTSAAATFTVLYFVEHLKWNWPIFRATVRRHWHFSKWLAPAEVLRWATGKVFFVATGALLGTAAVGALRAAQNLVGISHILQQGLDNITPVQAAARFRQGGSKALIAYIKRFALFGGLTMGIIVVVAVAAPEFWLRLVYGDEYSGWGYLVQWWAAIYIIRFLSSPLVIGLRAVEHTRAIFLANTWAGVLCVASAYPLIDLFGLSGVMLGLIIAPIIRILILSFAFTRHVFSDIQ